MERSRPRARPSLAWWTSPARRRTSPRATPPPTRPSPARSRNSCAPPLGHYYILMLVALAAFCRFMHKAASSFRQQHQRRRCTRTPSRRPRCFSGLEFSLGWDFTGWVLRDEFEKNVARRFISTPPSLSSPVSPPDRDAIFNRHLGHPLAAAAAAARHASNVVLRDVVVPRSHPERLVSRRKRTRPGKKCAQARCVVCWAHRAAVSNLRPPRPFFPLVALSPWAYWRLNEATGTTAYDCRCAFGRPFLY